MSFHWSTQNYHRQCIQSILLTVTLCFSCFFFRVWCLSSNLSRLKWRSVTVRPDPLVCDGLCLPLLNEGCDRHSCVLLAKEICVRWPQERECVERRRGPQYKQILVNTHIATQLGFLVIQITTMGIVPRGSVVSLSLSGMRARVMNCIRSKAG